MNICTSCGPASFRKHALVEAAHARAIKVLPVPGGPYIKQPLGGLMPMLTKRSLCVMGSTIASTSSWIWSSHPPTSLNSSVGGCDDQIQELVEAIVLPMTHKERFVNIGIKPPKGCLMYGPPGTGKTLMARACAASTSACFLKLAGPQLVQMFIGDGAKLVRDAFKLAKEKQPAIIFIDELDAVGTKRFDSELSGDREVQRTMLELLNQ